MPNYGEIAERVEGIVINPSDHVQAAIPRLIFEAQREAENRHAFQAMNGLWLCKTQRDSNLTLPWYSLMRNASSSRSASGSYSYLRARRERPYWVEFGSLPVVTLTPGGGEYLTVGDSITGDGYIVWVFTLLAGTPAAEAASLIRPGMHLVFQGFVGTSYSNVPWVGQTPYLVRQISSNVAGTVWTMVTSTPDGALPDPSGETFDGVVVSAVWDTPTDMHEMDWMNERDVSATYPAQTGTGNPKHVVEIGRDEIGIPQFQVYPKNDDESFFVVIPAYFHLTSSRVDLPGTSESCWFTNFADRYLEWRAASAACELEEDFEKADRYAERAEMELRRLIAIDKQESVRSTAFKFSKGARNTAGNRTPRV